MQKRWVMLFIAVAVCSVMFSLYTADRNRAAMQVSTYTAHNSVVILDAGHGGYDGGALSRDGVQEKDINLQIVLKLQRLLQVCGVKTVLTRTDDNSIHDPGVTGIRQQKVSDIHNRLRILENTEQGILISIHQNHFTKAKYTGTQVFYSGNDPASRSLANAIQSSVSQSLQPDNTRVIKRSGTEIYLLYHAQKPAVMVECGFLSNEQEAEKLQQESYQQQLALSIYQGLMRFFEDSEVV